jgi:hypothetical protein
MGFCRLRFLPLALGLLSCRHVGPCWWDGQQARETGMVQATSLDCDGVAGDPRLSVRYLATSQPLSVEIGALGLSPLLSFDASLADGTYSVEPPRSLAEDAGHVIASGADVTGTITFTRSRDIPFIDNQSPELKTYQSSLEVTFDLVAVLPHPDPAMGTGCKLVTGEQHVALVVSGPVMDCTSHPTLGVH